MVRQRGDGDCGVAALAILAEVPYEDAYVAVAAIDPKRRGKSGLFNRQLIAAAAELGIDLAPTRRYELDDDEGILRVRWNDPKRGGLGGHFVAVKAGVIYCPSDGNPIAWSEYLERFQARPCSLLKVTALAWGTPSRGSNASASKKSSSTPAGTSRGRRESSASRTRTCSTGSMRPVSCAPRSRLRRVAW